MVMVTARVESVQDPYSTCDTELEESMRPAAIIQGRLAPCHAHINGLASGGTGSAHTVLDNQHLLASIPSEREHHISLAGGKQKSEVRRDWRKDHLLRTGHLDWQEGRLHVTKGEGTGEALEVPPGAALPTYPATASSLAEAWRKRGKARAASLSACPPM